MYSIKIKSNLKCFVILTYKISYKDNTYFFFYPQNHNSKFYHQWLLIVHNIQYLF